MSKSFLQQKQKKGATSIIANLGHQLKCKKCSAVFYICASCFRGQAYCSQECRQGTASQQRQARSERYRQTPAGQTALQRAQKKWRKNKKLQEKEKFHHSENSEIDVSSQKDPPHCKLLYDFEESSGDLQIAAAAWTSLPKNDVLNLSLNQKSTRNILEDFLVWRPKLKNLQGFLCMVCETKFNLFNQKGVYV